jgi:hypothetical protein
MNTLTPLNPDTKPEQLPESPKPETAAQPTGQMVDTTNYVDFNVPDVEVEQPIAQPFVASPTEAPAQPAAFTAPRPIASTPVAFGGHTTETQVATEPSSGFLVGYIASLFAGVSVLYGLSSLGFILLDHFIKKPADLTIGGYFDASSFVSTWHVWLVASLVTFAVVYLILSRSAAKHIAAGLIPERQIQASEVARSIFTAVLVISSASLMASLLFTLLNGTLAAAEIQGEDIAIQIIGTIMTFAWVAIIVWHQSTIHLRGRNGIPGAILAVGVTAIAVVASIFLIGAGRNGVIDARTVSDLSTIQSELSSYKGLHETYPTKLTDLTIKDEAIKKRLGKYTYTQTESVAPSSSQQQSSFSLEDYSSSDSMYDMMSNYQTTSEPTSTTTSTYKLCATFLTDTSSKSNVSGLTAQSETSKSTSFNSHPKGEHCVERTL